jgi:multidrug efflux system membrane fusion protein
VIAAGAPVVRMAVDGPLDVVFAVSEGRIGSIALGSAAEIRSWSDGSRLPAVVREKAALADPVTRTYQVKLALDAKARLPLGSTVTVVPLALSHKGQPVIKLPTSALKQDKIGSAVWVLDSDSMTLRSQPVTIVAADGNEVVVSSGLEPGMLVVTAGVHVLSPGQKVTVYRSAQRAAPSTGGPDAGASAAALAASEAK